MEKKNNPVSVLTSLLCLHSCIIRLPALQLLYPAGWYPQAKMCSWLPHHAQTASLTMPMT